MVYATDDEPRGWLKTHKQKQKEQQEWDEEFQKRSSTIARSTRFKAETRTLATRINHQNQLVAGMFKDNTSGFKDQKDPCNKSNKSNGGEFVTYQSAYSKSYVPAYDMPVKFRRDHVPINAERTHKSLMSPKLPTHWERLEGQRIREKNEVTNLQLGNPNAKDPKFYKTTSMAFLTKHHKMLAQPNPGIASEDAKRAHKRQGLKP